MQCRIYNCIILNISTRSLSKVMSKIYKYKRQTSYLKSVLFKYFKIVFFYSYLSHLKNAAQSISLTYVPDVVNKNMFSSSLKYYILILYL